MDKQSAVWRQMQQQLATGGAAAGGNATAAGAGATATGPCRPNSARWTPTPEQVKILKDLYYDCGIRSPTAEQIQRIAARLRQYGRIEGKNVFYWFQNHKARERQKKRLGVDVNASPYPLLAGHGDVLALSPSSAGSSAGLYHGAGRRGAAALHPDSSTATTTCWGDITMQEYMGGARSTGAGHQIGAATAPTPSPACFVPFSTNQTPETLPLFPTGGAGQETVHDFQHGDGYHLLQSNSQWWGAAAATATATNSNAMTVHHHQLLQQQQHSFYSNQQLMTMMPRPSQQDAGTSLELTLRAPYPAGSM